MKFFKLILLILLGVLICQRAYSNYFSEKWTGKLIEERDDIPIYLLSGDEDNDRFDEILILDKSKYLHIFKWNGEKFVENIIYQSSYFDESKLKDVKIAQINSRDPAKILILDAGGEILIVNRRELDFKINPLKIEHEGLNILSFTPIKYVNDSAKEKLAVFAELKKTKEKYAVLLRTQKDLYEIFRSGKYMSGIIPKKLFSADLDGNKSDELIALSEIERKSNLIEIIKFEEDGVYPKVSKIFSKDIYSMHDIGVGDINGDGSEEIVLSVSKLLQNGSLLNHILIYKFIENDLFCIGEKYIDKRYFITLSDLNGDGAKEIILVDYDYNIKIISSEKVKVLVDGKMTEEIGEPIFMLDKIYIPLSYFREITSEEEGNITINAGRKKLVIEDWKSFIVEGREKTKIADDILIHIGNEIYLDIQVVSDYLKFNYYWDLLTTTLKINLK